MSTGENQHDADPFETDHWEFYVVPTSVINDECGDKFGRTKSLIKHNKASLASFNELKSEIDAALDVDS